MNIKKLYQANEKKVKLLKDKVFEPFIRLLSLIKVSPTFISILSLIFGLFAAVALVYSKVFFIEFILISLFFDWLDGSIARFENRGQDSSKGFWLDYSFDRIVVIVVMIMAYLIAKEKQILYLIAVVLYVLENLLFVFYHKKFQIIYIRTGYFVILIFNQLYATYFTIIFGLFNIFNFVISALRKKPL